MMQADYAVIGGTGVYDASLLVNAIEQQIETRFGVVSCVVGDYFGKHIAFMPRHGSAHSIAPHEINYRANLMALHTMGVRHVLATAAVGSVRTDLSPGSLVIVDQFLDFTKSRPTTFFEHGEPVAHVDMSDPYCVHLRLQLQQEADALNIPIVTSGTYVCTEGPRFETPAEIQMFARLGGDVVGMTSVPEVVLAKELGMCYATVAMVTNLCAGISGAPLSHQEVLEVMGQNVHRLRTLFFATLTSLEAGCACNCHQALSRMSDS